jgi:hypothetical protein
MARRKDFKESRLNRLASVRSALCSFAANFLTASYRKLPQVGASDLGRPSRRSLGEGGSTFDSLHLPFHFQRTTRRAHAASLDGNATEKIQMD